MFLLTGPPFPLHNNSTNWSCQKEKHCRETNTHEYIAKRDVCDLMTDLYAKWKLQMIEENKPRNLGHLLIKIHQPLDIRTGPLEIYFCSICLWSASFHRYSRLFTVVKLPETGSFWDSTFQREWTEPLRFWHSFSQLAYLWTCGKDRLNSILWLPFDHADENESARVQRFKRAT